MSYIAALLGAGTVFLMAFGERISDWYEARKDQR